MGLSTQRAMAGAGRLGESKPKARQESWRAGQVENGKYW